MSKMWKKGSTVKIIIFVAQILIAMACLYPVIFMAMNTFKSKVEYNLGQFALPKSLSFENYYTVFNKYAILVLFKNTAFIICMMLLISTIICGLAAYGFAKIKFYGRNTLFIFLISLMMIPGIVMYIPQYYNMAKLGLINNRWTVILIYVAMCIPYTTYLLTTNFRSIPNELIEAAKMDGARFLNIIKDVVFAVGKPGLITVIILNFTWYWNEFLVSMLFLQKSNLRTMTVGVAMIVSKFNYDIPQLLTGLFLTAVPCIIIYIIFQRYIIKGMTVGAIK